MSRAAGLEVHPLTYPGIASTFTTAGFREVARRLPGRPVMRRVFRGK